MRHRYSPGVDRVRCREGGGRSADLARAMSRYSRLDWGDISQRRSHHKPATIVPDCGVLSMALRASACQRSVHGMLWARLSAAGARPAPASSALCTAWLPATMLPASNMRCPPVDIVDDSRQPRAPADRAAGHVPGLQLVLEVAIEAAGGDPGQIDGGRARTPKSACCSHQSLAFAQETLVSGPATVRDAGGDHAVGEGLAVGHAQPAIVDEGALVPARRCRAHRGWDCRRGRRRSRPRARARSTIAEHRNAMQKIGCAVKRIDDPAMRLVGAGDGAALLH